MLYFWVEEEYLIVIFSLLKNQKARDAYDFFNYCAFAVLQSSRPLLNKQTKGTMDFYLVSC